MNYSNIQAEPYYSYVNRPSIHTICQKYKTIFPGLDPKSLFDPKSWNPHNFLVDVDPYYSYNYRSRYHSDFNSSIININSIGTCHCDKSKHANCPCGNLRNLNNFVWMFTSNVSGQDIDQAMNRPSTSLNHTVLNITSSYNNSLLNYILITFTQINFQGQMMSMDSYKEFSYPVPNGHLILFKFSLTFQNIYASRFNMFTEEPKAYVDVEIKDILPIPNSSYTIMQMEPKSQNICYEESQNNSKD
ncbi:39837_t:CDS:2 [Gigaspora margarita]|uniref:39837_t:CDS:1 n=1 Tax=Gigaspora margarita TaxID=4874 RepID=A0ABN7V9C3_GIGMA|nr:39837_t:CDS:2 [Gigaspora margarita]